MIFTLKTYDKAHKRAMRRGHRLLKVARKDLKKNPHKHEQYSTLLRRQLNIGDLIIDRMKREFNV